MIRLRGEKHHVEAIAVAVRVEVVLEVLAFAGKLGWVHSHAQSQSAICHSHAQRSAAVGCYARAVLHAVRYSRSAHVCPRQIASEFDGPSCVGAPYVRRVVFRLVIVGSKQRVAPEQLAVVLSQPFLYLREMLYVALFLLLAHLALVYLGDD